MIQQIEADVQHVIYLTHLTHIQETQWVREIGTLPERSKFHLHVSTATGTHRLALWQVSELSRTHPVLFSGQIPG